MTADLTGNRIQGWRFDLLDAQGVYLRALDAVADSGKLDWAVSSTPMASGTVDVADAEDYAHHRVRVWYQCAGQEDQAVFTGLIKTPDISIRGERAGQTLDLYDLTQALEEDTFGYPYGIDAGVFVADKVTAIIQSTLPSAQLIGDTSAMLATPILWEANTSKLKMVNDLLAAANCMPLTTDGMGFFLIAPYVAPVSRAVIWAFTDGAGSVFVDEWTRARDVSGVPNRWICVGAVPEAGGVPEIGISSDSTGTPFSFDVVGRWITQVETDVPSTGGLAAQAARKLAEAQHVTESFTISHPWLPNLRLNQAVTFAHSTYQFQPVKCTISGMSVTCDVKSLYTTILERAGYGI